MCAQRDRATTCFLEATIQLHGEARCRNLAASVGFPVVVSRLVPVRVFEIELSKAVRQTANIDDSCRSVLVEKRKQQARQCEGAQIIGSKMQLFQLPFQLPNRLLQSMQAGY